MRARSTRLEIDLHGDTLSSRKTIGAGSLERGTNGAGKARGRPGAGQAARTPGREVSSGRGDGAPIVPDAGAGTASHPSESPGQVASHLRDVGNAPQALSVGDAAHEDWSRAQDSGPSR